MSVANLQRHGFEVHDVEGWREHYHHTCKAWHQRLLANKDAAEREIGSVRTRVWLAYLAGCAYGFEGLSMGIYQTLAIKRESLTLSLRSTKRSGKSSALDPPERQRHPLPRVRLSTDGLS